tara:strand:- start:275 stop:484 length:210 start_codon:yes stop_codon:yes gene_type:complete
MEAVEVELVVIYVNKLQFVVLHNMQWLLVAVEMVHHTLNLLHLKTLEVMVLQEVTQQVLVKQLQVHLHI